MHSVFQHRRMIRTIKQHIRSKSGFTLIEVVLVTALISVMFAMIVAVIPTWYRAYNKTLRLNHARQMADSVIGTIEQTTRFANDITIDTDADAVQRLRGSNEDGTFAIPMEGSTNLVDGLVYDEKFYMNHDMELTFDLSADKSYCIVTVTFTEDMGGTKEQTLQKTRAIMLSGENN